MVTTYFKNLLAEHIWHVDGDSALPSSYWLAMSSTEPLENGTGVTEPTAVSGYTRIEISPLSSAVDGVVHNAAMLSWPKIVADQGSVSHWAIFDSETGGNLLMGEAFDSVKHLDAGTTVYISADNMELRVLSEG